MDKIICVCVFCICGDCLAKEPNYQTVDRYVYIYIYRQNHMCVCSVYVKIASPRSQTIKQ